MARIWGRPTIELKIALELSEEEARALRLICEYGMETLMKIFYTHFGERLVDEHKKGLVSLFETSLAPLNVWLNRIDQSRKLFNFDKED